MHTRKTNHVGIGADCGLSELEGIPDKIRNVLNVAVLIKVSKNNGLPFFLKARDLIF